MPNLAWSAETLRARAQRIATGPQSMQAAEAVRREIERRDTWPYVHVYPPPNSIRRTPKATVVCPAAGAANQVEMINPETNGSLFVVPSGNLFFMTHLGLYVGEQNANWNPGDFYFTVDKNVPVGVIEYQGVPLTDWANIPLTMGSLTQGPVKLGRAELFAPTDVIRAKVVNVNLGPGAPNWFACQIFGYLLPTVDAPNAE